MFGNITRLGRLTGKFEDFDWKTFFSSRGIDYRGEEVKRARKFRWENISPALPKEIGRVPLSEVCTLGAKHYVENFELFMMEPMDGKIPKAPRVMVDDAHWPMVCQGPVAAGVCAMLGEDEVFGLGGTCFIQPHESLLISSEDVRCFFYTMSVPPAWYKYLAFHKPVPEELVPEHLHGQTVYLAARVLPRGFLNSVNLAKHVHRNLTLWSGEAPDGTGIYLDNYDLLERVETSGVASQIGSLAPAVLSLRQEYEKWDIPRNEKKTVSRKTRGRPSS